MRVKVQRCVCITARGGYLYRARIGFVGRNAGPRFL